MVPVCDMVERDGVVCDPVYDMVERDDVVQSVTWLSEMTWSQSMTWLREMVWSVTSSLFCSVVCEFIQRWPTSILLNVFNTAELHFIYHHIQLLLL